MTAVVLLLVRVPVKFQKYLTLMRMQMVMIRHIAPMYFPENKARLSPLDQQIQFAQLISAYGVFGFF